MKLSPKPPSAKFSVLIAFIFLLSNNLIAQSQGNALIVTNADCKISVDGEDKGEVKANDPLKVSLS
ncbi:MAG TPA: hypothetical protein VK809_00400, partial [Bacteroidia bacterium]|nr:hypothetical protein [Bacteroidia bacterium]